MENASKALLIAGGVLLAILTLTLFVYVFRNMAQSSSNIYGEIEESEITKFNQQFFDFETKEEITMQDVISIIHLAKENNETGKMPVHIYVNVEGFGSDLQNKNETQITEILKNNFNIKYSKCQVSYAANSKLVGRIDITGKKTE